MERSCAPAPPPDIQGLVRLSPPFLGNPRRRGDSCAPVHARRASSSCAGSPDRAGLQPGANGRALLKGLPRGSSWTRGRGQTGQQWASVAAGHQELPVNPWGEQLQGASWKPGLLGSRGWGGEGIDKANKSAWGFSPVPGLVCRSDGETLRRTQTLPCSVDSRARFFCLPSSPRVVRPGDRAWLTWEQPPR